jgi:RNA-binding protein 39
LSQNCIKWCKYLHNFITNSDSRSKRPREEEKVLSAAEKAALEADKDQRTIFATNLSIKAKEDDIWKFFSKIGKVRDVRLITDRNSRKHKGFGYIEYADREVAKAALALSGQLLMGQPVQVQPSLAEKNRMVTT